MKTLFLILAVIIFVAAGCNSASPQHTVQNTNAGQKQSSTPDLNVDTSNWKSYRNEKYAFEIKYPQDWPVDFSGNVLTVGNAAAKGNPKCFLTITFAASKGAGSVGPAPVKHNEYDDIKDGERCDWTLKQIISSYKRI